MTARRRQRNRRGASRGNGQAKLVVLLCAVAIVAIMGGSLAWRALQPHIDPSTLCADGLPETVHVLLIDATDEINAVQATSIRNLAARMLDGVARGDRLEVYSIRDSAMDEDLLTPEFIVCRPDDGRGASIINANPEKLRELYETRFLEPLDKVMQRLLQAQPSQSSPIMRGVQAASVRGFGRWPAATQRRLVIVSDMLEYDAGRSHYSRSGFESTDWSSPAYRRLRADLRGVTVTIWYIWRETRRDVQGRPHMEYWKAYLEDQGALVPGAISVEG